MLRFFYKQPVYKPLAFGWQITKQLLWLNLLSLSNEKKSRFKKSQVEFSLRNKGEIAVKPTIHQNSAVSKTLLGKC